VRGVARAKIPFARASAAMVVVLEVTFPVQLADEALGRTMDRARGATAIWDDVAWGSLPTGSVLLVGEPRTMQRVLASRAAGALRPDLAVVPLYNLASPIAYRELAREPALAAVWRDIALSGVPGEWSLSSLAAERPLVVTFDPRWDKTLARHMVPAGLVSRFEPEPRGASDRKRALEALLPRRDRLAKEIAAEGNELLDVTVALLERRALATAVAGEKDVVSRAVEDVQAFAPDNALALELARRAGNKGPIDVKDLRL
jgi:hypothetical protein